MKKYKIHILTIFSSLLFCSFNYGQQLVIEDWHNSIKMDEEGISRQLRERLENSAHFETFTNTNGVKSYVLTPQPGKQQSTMYFTSPSFTNDGRYMWFWVQKDNLNTLALIDFEKDEVLQFDNMEIAESSSLVDVETRDVYWVEPKGEQRQPTDYYRVYKRGPGKNDKMEVINKIPHFVANCKPPRQVVTHLIYNASKTKFCFDSGQYYANNKTWIGVIPANGDPVEVWAELERRYNHAQMNPFYDDAMLVVQDYFYDYPGQYGEIGAQVPIQNRMWIAYSDGEVKPVFPEGNDIYHEWWDAGEDYLWYIDKKGNYGGKGVCRVPYYHSTRSFGQPELVWPNSLGHAETDSRSRYLIADHGHKTFEETNSVRVSFYNISTGKETDVVTSMPYPGWNADPHPHFAMNDNVICYTFSKTEESTIAITFTEEPEQLSR
ncbi:MAG: hypothetical protein LUG18_10490 [Candidatus Azobacteroides sp.]|nr:hypothetical protein [Candidatus Azobacteroides sp.]